MSTEIRNQPVPLNKMGQFHEILCATGGRYLGNPQRNRAEYRVSYIPGDYEAMCMAWSLVTQEIRETRKDQPWRKILRRITGFLQRKPMK